VVQNITMRLWQRLDRYDPMRGEFGGWLHRMVHNCIIDRYRANATRARRVVLLSEDDNIERMAEESAPSVDLSEIDSEKIWGLLRAAKPQQARALRLRMLAGLDIAEMVSLTGQNPNTLKVWTFRACNELRTRFTRIQAAE